LVEISVATVVDGAVAAAAAVVGSALGLELALELFMVAYGALPLDGAVFFLARQASEQ
jgi:hypothetical protein